MKILARKLAFLAACLLLPLGVTAPTPSYANPSATYDTPLVISDDGSHFCTINVVSLSAVCQDWNASGKTIEPSYSAQITTNSGNTCVLKLDGTVTCVGVFLHQDNSPGDTITLPVVLAPVQKIAASDSNLCFISKTNDLSCIGRLGIAPVVVPSDIGKVTDVYNRSNFICALTTTSNLKCFGNIYAAGTGAITPIALPSNLGKISSFSASNLGFCVVTTTGDLKCFGSIARKYLNGNVGAYSYEDLNPVQNPGKVTSVALDQYGSKNGCVITTVKTLKCWGYTRTLVAPSIDVPIDPASWGLDKLKNVVAVGTSWQMLCVVTAQAKTYGSSCFGNLANMNALGARSQVAPSNLVTATQIPAPITQPSLQVTPMMACLDAYCYGYTLTADDHNIGAIKGQVMLKSTLTVTGAKKTIEIRFDPVYSENCYILLDSSKLKTNYFLSGERRPGPDQLSWYESIPAKPGKHKVQIQCYSSKTRLNDLLPHLNDLLPKIMTFNVTVTK